MLLCKTLGVLLRGSGMCGLVVRANCMLARQHGKGSQTVGEV
jgi:hypothetical protein